MIITEFELRANWHKTKEKVITVPRGSIITPAARDFLRSRGIQVQIEGDGIMDLDTINYSTAQQSKTSPGVDNRGGVWRQREEDTRWSGGSGRQRERETKQETKPEHMTHLRGNILVHKTHPVIALRGQLDLLQCEIIEAQLLFEREGQGGLVAELEEILEFTKQVMAAEVQERPFTFTTLIGYTADELREVSHRPDKYFGVKHALMSYRDGVIVAKLHHLRAKSREVELQANRAFTDERGNCSRTDIVLALNRLSSAFYILACKARSQQLKAEKEVPIGVSNRHIHLSAEHLEELFGAGYELKIQKELSQPGQYAAEETVTLVGPKGSIERVRVLGPVRKQTQVEISVTDCYKLGVKPVVRDSGQLKGTEKLTVVGPAGKVELEEGVIVAARHIHMHTDQAKAWGLTDGQKVRVRVSGERPVIFEDVLVRVSPNFELELHLDTDEANAVVINNQSRGVILEV